MVRQPYVPEDSGKSLADRVCSGRQLEVAEKRR
jgi:hypothetical protein